MRGSLDGIFYKCCHLDSLDQCFPAILQPRHSLGTTHQMAQCTYYAILTYDVHNINFYTHLFILNDKMLKNDVV